MRLPNSRATDIIESDLGSELLVYDLTIHKAFSLNETSKIVYRACGQKMSFEELKKRHQFTDEIIYLALDGLKKENLLTDEYISPFAGLSRREIIRTVGLASMIALPVIMALVAPTAAMAQSTCQSGLGPSDSSGIQGNGDHCFCDNSSGFFGGACNTTRGGNAIDAPNGCRAGCVCRSSITGTIVLGTCG